MTVESRLPNTRFCHQHQEGALPAIAIEHPAFSASILMQGGQLIRFAPAGQGNWLWLSETEPFNVGKAVRGGVPVCWPWFGDPSRNPAPVRQHIRTDQAHGLVRNANWHLETVEEWPDRVSVALACDTSRLPADLWLGQARVVIRFLLAADRVEVALETTNTGTETLHLSQALHSYFPTEDIHLTRIHGLDGVRYTDAMDSWRTHLQEGPVEFHGETDRIYTVTGLLELATPEGVMQLAQQNARSTVIWNPWQEKARRLSHFPPAAWERMFCVETANALDDYVSIKTGGIHSMGFCLSRA